MNSKKIIENAIRKSLRLPENTELTVKHLERVRVLDLLDTKVTNISALAGLTNLQTLYLHNTKVTDVSALASIEGLRIYR